jgi:hypothetical protein
MPNTRTKESTTGRRIWLGSYADIIDEPGTITCAFSSRAKALAWKRKMDAGKLDFDPGPNDGGPRCSIAAVRIDSDDSIIEG